MSTPTPSNPRTTLHPALIRQPPATYQTQPNAQAKQAVHEFEMTEPSLHPNMTPTLAPTSPPLPSTNAHSRRSSGSSSADSEADGGSWGRAPRTRGPDEGSVPVHQRGGGGKGLCCGICAGLACFECLECCC
ncbi:hypothetical protein MFRU_003g01470 [Monilinia fructicola]|nr:hypothetical protein MFRU_003g01470 [Monilinia fructicola]